MTPRSRRGALELLVARARPGGIVASPRRLADTVVLCLARAPLVRPFSHQSTTLLILTNQPPINARDLDTGAQLAAFKATGGGTSGGGGGANACAGRGGLCAVGRGYLCAAQRHKDSLTFWAWHRDQPLRRCFAPERLTAVASSPDGALVAGGGASGALYLWLAGTGELLRAWPAHYRPVSALAFADGGGVLVSGGDDALVLCWAVADAVDAMPDATRRGGGGGGGAAGAGAAGAARPAGQQQSSSSSSFAHARLEPMHTWSGHTLSVQAIHCGGAAATSGGTTAVVATASADRTVRLWSLSTGRLLLALDVPAGGAAATAVCLDPGEHSVYVGGADGAVYEASLAGGGGGGAGGGQDGGGRGSAEAAAAAAAASAARGGAGGDGAASGGGPCLRRLPGGGHSKAVVSLSVVPPSPAAAGDPLGGGDRLVSASEDGTARVWDLRAGGQCVRTLQAPARAPIAAALALPAPAALLAGAGSGGLLAREAPRRAQPLAPLAKFAGAGGGAAVAGAGWAGAGHGQEEQVPIILDGVASGAARRDPLLADEVAAAAADAARLGGGGGGPAAAALYAGVGALL
jgi:pre-rRNA-processing protein IPI3